MQKIRISKFERAAMIEQKLSRKLQADTHTHNTRMKMCKCVYAGSNSKFSMIVIEIEKKSRGNYWCFSRKFSTRLLLLLLRSQSIVINIFCPSRELNLFSVRL